jgi:hypothetical protein
MNLFQEPEARVLIADLDLSEAPAALTSAAAFAFAKAA